jgi:hypothetical protein
MKNKIYFSTFNLYKGGSLTIYNAIKPFFKKDQEVVEFNPPYPFFINSKPAPKVKNIIKYPRLKKMPTPL